MRNLTLLVALSLSVICALPGWAAASQAGDGGYHAEGPRSQTTPKSKPRGDSNDEVWRELERSAKRNGKRVSREEIAATIKKAAKKGDDEVRKQLRDTLGSPKVFAAGIPDWIARKGLEKVVKALTGRLIENPIGLDCQEVSQRKGPAPRQCRSKDGPAHDPGRLPRDSNERGDLNDHRTA